MPKASSDGLDSGDIFPNLSLELTDGPRLDYPAVFGDNWKVILFFRGYF